MALNFKDAEVISRDVANQRIVRRVSSKSLQLGLFGATSSAQWAADKFLKVEAFTTGVGSFPANRRVFKLQPGDAFILNYEPYGISGRVWRVLRIEEESPDSERIVVNCFEDVYYLSNPAHQDVIQGLSEVRVFDVLPLDSVSVIEAPYVLNDVDDFTVIPLAGRETNNELGYQFLTSTDDATYTQLGLASSYQVHGIVSEYYPSNTFTIDDLNGLLITFDNSDVSLIETVSRNAMLFGYNSAIVGNELITFQTITPVTGMQYRLTGVSRGRWDTQKKAHFVGEDFWFIGISRYKKFGSVTFIPGVTRYFKSNPYSQRYTGEIASAEVRTLYIEGRSRKPYQPANFMCEGEWFRPTYSSDIVLTWSPRIRGGGAGYYDPSTVVDAAVTWEGKFQIAVYAGGGNVRTVDEIDATTWTYTQAMNLSDNVSLPTVVLFKLTNYRDIDGVRYYSPDKILKVYNPSGVDLGGASTSSTTTTTSSTTSSTSSTSSTASTSSMSTTTTLSTTSQSTTTGTTMTLPEGTWVQHFYGADGFEPGPNTWWDSVNQHFQISGPGGRCDVSYDGSYPYWWSEPYQPVKIRISYNIGYGGTLTVSSNAGYIGSGYVAAGGPGYIEIDLTWEDPANELSSFYFMPACNEITNIELFEEE
jgi:hypothetical protein